MSRIPHYPNSLSEAEQWVKVWKFRDEVSKDGLVKAYKGPLGFQRLIRNDLLKHAMGPTEPPYERREAVGFLSCTVLSGAKTVCAEGIAERTADIELLFEG